MLHMAHEIGARCSVARYLRICPKQPAGSQCRRTDTVQASIRAEGSEGNMSLVAADSCKSGFLSMFGPCLIPDPVANEAGSLQNRTGRAATSGTNNGSAADERLSAGESDTRKPVYGRMVGLWG